MRRAVEELIAESGPERLTIPLVAQRASVHPSSIYRRWGDISTLVAQVVAYRLDPSRPLPTTGDLRSDAVAWGQELASHFGSPERVALLRAGAALAGDEGQDCTAQWREEATSLVAAASDPGIHPRDLVDHVLAPIVYHAIFSSTPITDADVQALVDDALSIARAQGSTPNADGGDHR